MDIGYVWDEHKYEQVRDKHSVDFGEVVDVFEGKLTLYEEDPQGNPERLMAVGQTRSGRVLQVIFTDEDAPLVRLVTAFDASKEWEYEFRK
ncbi:BrnT family toxin [Persicimonas caeni]|uniref:BrnT family toxin n=1 Tax=Persicimonas caeni TaxID=2292766 RepID=A0A4Y6PUY6_PERCE|nr:BrnT family toxin [Persicimonas caeni]QDG52164.1 BrnT family toxin [Persicimonas caeni]QED33386.1 BrnT family toxin [Persicimonas caeni]